MREIKIDFDNPGLPQRLDVVENDAQSRFFKAVLYKDGKAYSAPSGATYSIMYRGFGPQNEGWYDTINDGAGKRAACSVSGNVVTCEIARQALRVPGHVSVVLCVTGSNGYMLHGWPIDCNCRNDNYTGGTSVESFFYITQVTNADWTSAIKTWEELKNMIDPTLSLSGKAADAKATGDAVGEIKEDILDTSPKYASEGISNISDRDIVKMPIPALITRSGYRLDESGYYVSNDEYITYIYRVREGENIYISTDGTLRFQKDSNIPGKSENQNNVGNVMKEQTAFFCVPKSSNFIAISTQNGYVDIFSIAKRATEQQNKIVVNDYKKEQDTYTFNVTLISGSEKVLAENSYVSSAEKVVAHKGDCFSIGISGYQHWCVDGNVTIEEKISGIFARIYELDASSSIIERKDVVDIEKLQSFTITNEKTKYVGCSFGVLSNATYNIRERVTIAAPTFQKTNVSSLDGNCVEYGWIDVSDNLDFSGGIIESSTGKIGVGPTSDYWYQVCLLPTLGADKIKIQKPYNATSSATIGFYGKTNYDVLGYYSVGGEMPVITYDVPEKCNYCAILSSKDDYRKIRVYLHSANGYDETKKYTPVANELSYIGGRIIDIYNPYKNHGANQYMGQLHMHSWGYGENQHSGSYRTDAKDAEVMETLKSLGYDFGAYTNYYETGIEPNNTGDFVWMWKAEEQSFSNRVDGKTGHHIIVWNCDKPITNFYGSPYMSLENITKAFGKNYILELAHPQWNPTLKEPDELKKVKGLKYVESYNAVNGNESYEKDSAFDTLLSYNNYVYVLGVSDSHSSQIEDLSTGNVKLFGTKKDRVEIYNALMNGAFYACDHISARISDIIFKNNTFTIETGDLNATTIFYKENRTKVKTAFGSTASYTLNGDEKFVRAVVALSNGHNIMTQPIFLINNMQN